MMTMMVVAAPVLESDEENTSACRKSWSAFIGTASPFETASWTFVIMMMVMIMMMIRMMTMTMMMVMIMMMMMMTMMMR